MRVASDPSRGKLEYHRTGGGGRAILLAIGFTALLLVIAASSFAVWRNARNEQARVAALHEAHSRAANALSTIRSNVYLIATLARDYLLDEDPAQARRYVQELNTVRKATEDAFHELQATGQDSEQKRALEKLRAGFEVYWDPTEIALDWTPAEKRLQRAQMLRKRGIKRQEVFELASQVEELMTENFRRERARITSADREFRASLGWTTMIALLLGITIAAATVSRIMKLERQSLLAESELRRLSGQIRTAQEQERRNLARELHDQVGQLLTGLRMELASMARIHGDAESEVSSRIARAKGTVEQTLRVVRNIAMLLRPSMLDDLGLAPAIAWLVKDMSRASGIEIKADVDPSLDSLPDAHRTCLYRVVQEAITNAVRHSGGSQVDVIVKPETAWVVATIFDDGRGFTSGAVQKKGLGLVGMDERARELGGNMRIESLPGRGARIEVRLPRPAIPEVANDQDLDRGRSRDRANRIKAAV
jgi:signal transduction histidine kinase